MDTFTEQEYSKNFDLALWRKMAAYVKPHGRTLLFICLAMMATAMADAFFPLATKYAIDNFIEKRDLTTLPVFVCVYVGAICWQCTSLFFFIEQGGRLETNIVYDIRKAGFAKLQKLSFSYYDTTPVGWIMARMTSDAQRIGDVVAWGAVDVFWAVSIITIVLISMFILNPGLACILLFILPVLTVVSFYFQKRILKSQREVRQLNSKITGVFNEGIIGARTTKTLIREEANAQEFNVLSLDMKTASIRSAVLSAVFLPVVLSISAVAVGLVLYRGGNMVIFGKMGYGTLSVFIAYAMQIFEPIQQIARIFSEMQSAQASAERTFSLVETDPDIQDDPELIAKYADKKTWPSIHGDIVFDNVSFSYKNGEQVLQNFNLHVKAGEKIALVGATGAGKSTIVNLLCRFYEPTEGQILIDGVDYRERPQIWLQSNLGYVLQTPHLFSGSIMGNIRYGHLEATDESVIAAAKVVNAYDFIMKKPAGFQTEVGEGGDKLSAGEKQLVSFARAILGNPRLFVLDEATSSIDTETEMAVQKAVDEVLKGRTSFIVAHRLSTIRNSDRILVIEDGQIIESGNHKALMGQKGHYYQLYTNQFKAEAEGKLLNG